MIDASSSAARHPIRVVARRTGLTAEVIRAWEQRYGVVTPSRTESGRRLYNDADVERLSLLRRAVQGGRSIGQVAPLADPSLRALVAEDAALPPPPPTEDVVVMPVVLREALAAVRRMDALRLEAVLRSAAISVPVSRLTDEVLAPLMREIGDGWAEGRLGVLHEHVASAMVRAVVSSLPLAGSLPASAPLVVVATPSGQHHELGAMAVAAAASADGWRVLYLGADTPASDIARAAKETGATAIALSLTYPQDDPTVAAELRELRRLAPAAAIVAGGLAAGSYADVLATIGALVVNDMAACRRALGTLRRGAA